MRCSKGMVLGFWVKMLLFRVRTAKVDRKSTRLNSSHQIISYAVFCLKKKKKPISVRYTHPAYSRSACWKPADTTSQPLKPGHYMAPRSFCAMSVRYKLYLALAPEAL